MSEFTKGKLKIRKYRGLDAIYLDGKCVCKVAFKDFAKELVRRWNAFEEDGLVSELVGGCHLGLTIANWASDVRNAPKGLIKDIKKLETILAKASQ